MKRYLYMFLMIVVGVTVVLVVLQWRKETAVVEQPPGWMDKMAIAVTDIKKRDLADARIFTGNLKANSSFDLATKVPGRLETLTVTTGNPVEPGQLVAKIDDVEYIQQLAQAKANLEVGKSQVAAAKITLEQSEREFKRYKSMYDNKVCSEAQFEQAESARNSAQAMLEMREADVKRLAAILENAETRLADTTITANWTGGVRYVGKRFVDPGALLTVNAPIITVIDISALKAEINVIESDYPKLKLGDEAIITTDAYPGEKFIGKVYTIAQNLDAATRQAPVTVKIPNTDGKLKPGMFVRVTIELAHRKNVPTVPRESIVKRRGKIGVFLYQHKDGNVRFMPVNTGLVDGNDVEVDLKDISLPVVTIGVHQLNDGASVIDPAELAKKE
ncbi:MAG: efflux RND transporter periplasmic adaptor subunit [Victivallaceae bacterium]|nr:efflux RND transporter periplasmic adaptor subunit [Victivallaceae bacterium]